MRRYAEEAAVISAGVEAAHVKVPMVAREHQHVCSNVVALALFKAAEKRIVEDTGPDIRAAHLLVKADDRVRVAKD